MSWFDEGTNRQRRRRTLLLLLAIWAGSAVYARYKPLPSGVSIESRAYQVPARNVSLLADVTGIDAGGQRFSRQEIFDQVLAAIREAKRFVVMDFFLFNQFRGTGGAVHRDLTAELTAALLEKRRTDPGVLLVFLTDPINTVYGGAVSPELARLQQAVVTVVTTDLNKLRDPNPLYAGFWRPSVRFLGNQPGWSWLPNPFDHGGKVNLRAWLAMLNFKANHRKVLIADRGSDAVSLVTSWNPHSASSAHSNIALQFTGGPWKELLASEAAVARFSGTPFGVDVAGLAQASLADGQATAATSSMVSLQVVTEGKIADALERQLGTAGPGDRVDAFIFYFSDRSIIKALVAASKRGAIVRLLLDPNKDAFGRIKNGIPNRPVASELMLHSSARLFVQWYDTHGEQAHDKLLLIRKTDGSASMVVGSANWTKRNLRDLNLETSVVVGGSQDAQPLRQAQDLFDLVWGNARQDRYSTGYATYRQDSVWQMLRYRVMEFTGLSSF